MSQPAIFDIPHELGRVEAKRRMTGRLADLERALPFANRVETWWQDDRMVIEVEALGQNIRANLDVYDALVRMELRLPGLLGLLSQKIADQMHRSAAKLLEAPSPPGKS